MRYLTALLARSDKPRAPFDSLRTSRSLAARKNAFRRRLFFLEQLEDRRLLATFAVVNINDSGPGSLRAAILDANNAAGNDIVDLTAITGSINLASPLPDLTSNMHIQGPGTANLTVRRDTGGNYRIFTVMAGATIAFDGLTVSNGLVDGVNIGGGIANFGGTLTVNSSTFTGNTGSGIYNTGILEVEDSTFESNIGAIFKSLDFLGVTSDVPIAGIFNSSGGMATVSRSLFLNNHGTGAFNDYVASSGSPVTTLVVNDSTFSRNQSAAGGGIYHHGGEVRVNNSTFSHNSARGLFLSSGGGLCSFLNSTDLPADNPHKLFISNSTFSENYAGYNADGLRDGGGGGWGGGLAISFGIEAEINNSTIVGNKAWNSSAGILISRAKLTVTNSTIYGNHGEPTINSVAGGIGHLGFVDAANPPPVVSNTIIAGNTAHFAGPDFIGEITSNGYNLIGNANGARGESPYLPLSWLDATGDLVNVAPMLAPLGNYGGPTQTMALLPGSPAIDAGDNTLVPGGVIFDQRGTPYSRMNGVSVDIGAFETSVDTDGVSDALEDAGPNGGDGNSDSIPDSQQNQVTSLPNSADQQYVTLVSPISTNMVDVAAIPNPSPANSPAGIQFPIGHLEFTVENVSVGNATTVTLILPDDTLVNTYYKYGRTVDDPTPHWYEFLFDGSTGAEIFAGPDADSDPEIVILHFVDGQRGDDDLSANGQVHDPGSPAFRPNSPPVLDTLSATSVYENGTVHLTGTYHDPDAHDTHMLTIYWGEGAPQTVPVSGGTFDITHQYLDDNPTNTASDLYTIDVTLTDDSGPTPNLVHLYQFNGNLDDSVGNIPLINNGGTLNPTSLSFGPNQGPTLIAETGLAENYSIGMRVALSDAYYYRKVIDFSNLASDNGQYFSQNTLDDPQSYLEFFPFLIGPTTFDYDATVEVVFSRDGDSGLFTMYLNGLAEGSFIDSDGDAIATLMGSNSIFHFFQDDIETGMEEASAGEVDEIRIWDGPLTGWDSASTSVTVSNVAPHDVLIAASVSELVFAVGSSQPFSGSFKDVGTADTHTSVWTFTHLDAAGAVVTETRTGVVTQASGSGTVNNSFSFSESGVYQVTLTVKDDDTGVKSSLTSLFVVYDPSAGFVTGGGWINSPAGAYVANPTLMGKANFGFNSKYQNGNNVPTGNTEFQFKAGDFNFKSSSYEWLFVSGAKARFRGVGTVNGIGGYGFELTAWDGQVNGGGGADKFRIKIWNGSPGNVVYDNQMNAPDGANPTTLLGGGSIVIHKSGQPLLASGGTTMGSGTGSLTQETLNESVSQAINYWQNTGVDASAVSNLQHLHVEIADLFGDELGIASDTDYVWIDRDAAGYGWQLDSLGGIYPSITGGMDLLSVVAHELGHKLGLEHSHADNDLMAQTLHVGVRSLVGNLGYFSTNSVLSENLKIDAVRLISRYTTRLLEKDSEELLAHDQLLASYDAGPAKPTLRNTFVASKYVSDAKQKSASASEDALAEDLMEVIAAAHLVVR